MAKKDESGRLTIPEEFLRDAHDYTNISSKAFFFFMDGTGAIGILSKNTSTECRCTNGFKFLGDCDYDIQTHTFSIPENVELALGEGENYFFALSTQPYIIYLYKSKVR